MAPELRYDAQLAPDDQAAPWQVDGRGAPELEADDLPRVDASKDVDQVVGLSVHAEMVEIFGHQAVCHRVKLAHSGLGEVPPQDGLHPDGRADRGEAEEVVEHAAGGEAGFVVRSIHTMYTAAAEAQAASCCRRDGSSIDALGNARCRMIIRDELYLSYDSYVPYAIAGIEYAP